MTALGYWLFMTSAIAVGVFAGLWAYYATMDLVLILPAMMRMVTR